MTVDSVVTVALAGEIRKMKLDDEDASGMKKTKQKAQDFLSGSNPPHVFASDSLDDSCVFFPVTVILGRHTLIPCSIAIPHGSNGGFRLRRMATYNPDRKYNGEREEGDVCHEEEDEGLCGVVFGCSHRIRFQAFSFPKHGIRFQRWSISKLRNLMVETTLSSSLPPSIISLWLPATLFRHCVLHMENPASPSRMVGVVCEIIFLSSSGLIRHGSVFAVQAGWEKSSMNMLSYRHRNRGIWQSIIASEMTFLIVIGCSELFNWENPDKIFRN
ncbi:hypothetical protein V8G54_026360 [Vigna mungo]|uniref:Uncharacterized protein n=1 Tax=Vigna mungo TaxID=3915 RepID=A0AAQ3N0W2_VIGMU